MKKTNGIIAFLDIIGFSTFIENNGLDESAQLILKLINNLPSKVKETHINKFKNVIPDSRIKSIESIQTMVFSDTILFTFPFSNYEDDRSKSLDWGFANLYLGRLFKSFMDNGLPLRGGVSYGEIITYKACFIGTPIIYAHNVEKELDSAGIVFDKTSVDEILRLKNKYNYDFLFADKSIPIKTKKNTIEDKFFVTIKPYYSKSEIERLKNNNELESYLTTSFTAHKKELNNSATKKLKNTLSIYEHMLFNVQSSDINNAPDSSSPN